jgi:hypothetical protein
MLKEITTQILNQLPKETKLSPEDIVIIKKNKAFFFSIVDKIVIDFYDTLYANPETKVIFNEGERPIREKSLKKWFVETIEGEFDLDYWSWQTFVGIMHVKRKVKNNMMIAMMSRVSDMFTTEAILTLPSEDVIALKSAWSKFSGTVLALIGEAYHIFYMKAVGNTTGLPQKLIENTVKVEIDNLIDQFSSYSRHR